MDTQQPPEAFEDEPEIPYRSRTGGRTSNISRLQRLFDAAPWRVVIVSIVLIIWSLQLLTQQSCGRVDVVVAAGGQDGESYKMLTAVKTLLERQSANVKMTVLATRGTEENLRLLRDGNVHLATAQADVSLEDWLSLRTLPSAPNGAGARRKLGFGSANAESPEGGLVAVLFVDKIQLLACGLALEPQQDALTAQGVFSSLIERGVKTTVYLPYEAGGPSGGQYRTFLRVARHYGLHAERDFEFRSLQGEIPLCDRREQNRLVFRVRAEGNAAIQRALNRGWRLVELRNTGSLRLTNRALVHGRLFAGTYRVRHADGPSSPAPPRDLDTVAVRRLLLARRDKALPGWLVRQVAGALNERGTDLARTTTVAPDAMDRFFLNVSGLNSRKALAETGLPLHPEVAVYYDPRLSWFAWLNSNGDGLGFVLGIIGIIASGLEAVRRGIKRWFLSSRKDFADRLVNRATRLMKPTQLAGLSSYHFHVPMRDEPLERRVQTLSDEMETRFGLSAALPSDTLEAVARVSAQTKVNLVLNSVYLLVDAQGRLVILDQLFNDAGQALDDEEISEESFRTVNQAIRAAREAIESDIESNRRQISLHFVQRLMRHVPDGTASGPVFADPNLADADPEDILHEALPILTSPIVFSRESFRTFTDAYHLARPVPLDVSRPAAPSALGEPSA